MSAPGAGYTGSGAVAVNRVSELKPAYPDATPLQALSETALFARNCSHQGETMAALSNRLKAATLGFGITVAPLAIVATAHLTFMPQIVAAMEGLDSNDRAMAVSSLRSDWFAMHSVVATTFAIYWVITAVCGREQILRSRAANSILAFCATAYLAITLYFIFVQWPDGLEVVCPLLGISNTDAPPFGFDVPTSCGAFVYAANQMIVLGLVGLIVPLIISLIVRIVSSRRAYQLKDDAPPPLLE